MRKILLVVSLICYCCLLNAQPLYLTNNKQTEKLSKDVADLFLAEKVAEAMALLNPYWLVRDEEKKEVVDKSSVFRMWLKKITASR